MQRAARLAKLAQLQASLATTRDLINDLHNFRTVVLLARDDPERWTPLLDSLAAALEPGELGSVQQALTALAAALADR